MRSFACLSRGIGSLLLAAVAAGMACTTPAAAQSGAPQDSVGQEALDAVTQPLSDLGLRSREIPLILLAAQGAPYDLSGMATCDQLRGEIVLLEDTLGPDADAVDAEGKGLVNRGLQAGGELLGDFIPFRGLVRRVSGARAHEARWEAAIYAGVARRSFLKGVLAGRECPTMEEQAVSSARDLLGLAPADTQQD